MKRVFLIVLDSLGIGAMPDAASFGDAGSNTLAAIAATGRLDTPVLSSLGFYNIEGVSCCPAVASPLAGFARLEEVSPGKDTTIGHWEIAGAESKAPLPVYPDGFPQELVDAFAAATGRGVLCNKPYSGTAVIQEYGEEHMRTGDLIVYTSADSVWQIAAHEEVVPLEELYRCCRIARDLLTGPHGVGRVIARPFVGADKSSFQRTPNRHDYSLEPPSATMLDALSAAGLDVIGVGKISDIFAGRGITQSRKSKNNDQGMDVTLALAGEEFHGLAFINLVDFDMLYGHRNDAVGYADALTAFDRRLAQLLPLLREEDVLMITADHGCDPSTPSTDHSREYVPLIIYGAPIRSGVDLGTRRSFAHVGSTVLDYLGVPAKIAGKSLLPEVLAK